MGGEARNPLPAEAAMAAALLPLLAALCLATPAAAFRNLTTLRFDDGYTPLFGESNIVPSADGRSVRLLLDHYTGSGFISSDLYNHGFFSAKIKLPSNYTAGVVVAFYVWRRRMSFLEPSRRWLRDSHRLAHCWACCIVLSSFESSKASDLNYILEELVGYYLKRKVGGQEIELEVIPVIDLYKFDPWDLPGNFSL